MPSSITVTGAVTAGLMTLLGGARGVPVLRSLLGAAAAAAAVGTGGPSCGELRLVGLQARLLQHGLLQLRVLRLLQLRLLGALHDCVQGHAIALHAQCSSSATPSTQRLAW